MCVAFYSLLTTSANIFQLALALHDGVGRGQSANFTPQVKKRETQDLNDFSIFFHNITQIISSRSKIRSQVRILVAIILTKNHWGLILSQANVP